MSKFRAVAGTAAIALGLSSLAGIAPSPAQGVPAAELIQGCAASVPEPDGTPVSICYTVYRPPTASAESPVPLIFHSHGWGGSRTNSPTAFQEWMDDGFGVLSFDQRGFGASGGKAHVENPDFEGQDVQRLIDVVAGLDWVAQEAEGDPIIGAIGGSYGGGYQYVGAFTELRDHGATRFDALAPEITWWDLKESLAPSEVVRTAWVAALYAAGADAHTTTVHKGFAIGATTGDWPKGELDPEADMDEFFRRNGPAWHVSEGRQLDIPVLIGQGATDNLFNLNQGLKSFDQALTPAARAQSIFVGYNGGHALPSAVPPGVGSGGDPCSTELTGANFAALARRFMAEKLKGEATGLAGFGQYHLATAAGGCLHLSSLAAATAVDAGQITSPSGAGVPQHVALVEGPVTVAGTPWVDATVTTTGLDTRLFLALSVGTTPADARIVQNNMLPLREPTAVTGAARTIELPAVAVEVPAGQTLYLTVSPVSDMSFGHGSRTPGLVVLDGVTVRLPTVS